MPQQTQKEVPTALESVDTSLKETRTSTLKIESGGISMIVAIVLGGLIHEFLSNSDSLAVIVKTIVDIVAIGFFAQGALEIFIGLLSRANALAALEVAKLRLQLENTDHNAPQT